MEIHGYKSFFHPMQTRYGQILEVGKRYITDGEIKYGTVGNGFHFCETLEETLRYVDTKKEFDVCEVIGSGEILERYDDYNDYNIFVASEIEIIKLLSREEILKIADKMSPNGFIKFVKHFPLAPDEITYFIDKYKNDISVLQHIRYYKLNDEKAFENSYYTKQKKE
jgi:hypothetical protein